MRVWESARRVKQALYDLVDSKVFDRADRLRSQLREASASAVSQMSEGYVTEAKKNAEDIRRRRTSRRTRRTDKEQEH